MRLTIPVLLVVSASILGCNKPPDNAAPPNAGGQPAPLKPGEKPSPPLSLETPPPPDTVGNLPAAKLMALAKQAEQQQHFKRAIRYMYAAVQQGGGNQYDLACYYSRDGNVNAALYWLQKGGLEVGVDPEWASQDSDLNLVRADPRWQTMQRFLRQCGEYWANQGQPVTVLLLPKGYSKDTPIPALVGLHGMGHNPTGFMAGFQDDADDLKVAFIGVSGTIPRGKKSFVWSPDTAKNAQRVDAALKEVASKVTIKPGKIILFGFSQGGQASVEIAVREPDKYAGAIVLSPGGLPQPLPQYFTKKAGRLQGFVLSVGGREAPGNVALTRDYANLLWGMGARVFHKQYPNMAQHALPPDFVEVLPSWVDFILDETRKSP